MTIAWMLYVLLVGTLVVAGAAAVASALLLAGRATRWAWAASLAAVALFAMAALSAPLREDAPVAAVQVHRVPLAYSAPHHDLLSMIGDARVVVAAAGARAIATVGARVPSGVAKSLVVGWIVSSALLLAIYLLVSARLSLARRRWPIESVNGVAVRVAPSAGPAVIGLLRAEIVVPRSLLARSEDERRLILDHEGEHLRAGDHLLLGAACLAAIAFPWHPAVWYALARLRLAVELDCDARVLRRGVAPRPYGTLLIDMAARGSGIHVGTLALADRPSHLERRLRAMSATRSRFMLVRAGALCGAAALAVLVACEAKVPTAADVASMNVASAEKTASDAGLLRTPSSSSVDFFVNGEKVTPEQARAMEAKIIGSIEVVRSERAGGRDTIFVTTSDRMPKVRASAKAVLGAPELAREETSRNHLSKDTLRVRTMKTMNDSSEHMVAHVERELAMVRAAERGAPDARPNQRVALRTPAGDGGEPVFMVDGKTVSSAAFAAVREEDIASISVYKGEQATRFSADPAAKNGVIAVVRKTAKKQ